MQKAHSVTSNRKGLWGNTQNKVVFRHGISLEYDHMLSTLIATLGILWRLQISYQDFTVQGASLLFAHVSLSWLFLKTDGIYSHALCWSVISAQSSGLCLSVTAPYSSFFPTEAVFSKEAPFGRISQYNKKLAACLSSVTHQASNMLITGFPQIKYHHSIFQPWSW